MTPVLMDDMSNAIAGSGMPDDLLKAYSASTATLLRDFLNEEGLRIFRDVSFVGFVNRLGLIWRSFSTMDKHVV